MGKISLNSIAEELAAKSGITRDAADSFMHAFIATIEKGLHEDNIVKIKGLGTFKLMAVSDRSSVDVNTGERITIKGHTKVSFTPDSAMKEFVNRPFAHFEPTELNDGYPAEEEPDTLDGVSSDENDDIEIAEPAMVETELAEAVGKDEPMVIASAVADVVEAEEGPVKESETVIVDVESAVVPVEEVVEESDSLVSSSPNEHEEANAESIEVKEEGFEEVVSLEEKEEETVSEDVVSKEEATPEDASEGIITPTVDMPKPKEARKKRRGCGCLWVLLFVVLILIGATVWLSPMFVSEDSYEEEMEEFSDMRVNPNLEEELGAEWGDEPEVKTELPVKKDEAPEQIDSIVVPEAEDDKAEQKTSAPAVVSEGSKSQNEKVTPAATDEKFCSVIITESLEAKTIKDITPADTTDYLMEGTLVTHELKRGETIIQLALKYYGDKRLWPYIVKYNWMKDFNNVAIGQMINIPVLKEKSQE